MSPSSIHVAIASQAASLAEVTLSVIPRQIRRTSRVRAGWPPLWAVVVAASFCAYFLLLVYCDVTRPENAGFLAVDNRVSSGVLVAYVAPGSPADRAGLQTGDRILSVNHVAISGRGSRGELGTIMETDTPMPVVVARGTSVLTVLLRLGPTPVGYWRTQASIILVISLGAQLLTLIAALFVAWRRPRDPVALAGSWFLLACATFTIALPMRLASVWRELPLPLGALLWLPHASSLAIGPVLLTFVTVFPRRIPHAGFVQAATWAVAGAALAAPLYNFADVVYGGKTLRSVGPGAGPLFAVTLVSLAAAMAIVLFNYRRIDDVNERRRLRAVVAGIAAGVAPAFPMFAYYWITPRENLTASLFESPAIAFAAVAMLAAPLSITYAILRHRLFDVSFIIREWLRYALARWTAISVPPVLRDLSGGRPYTPPPGNDHCRATASRNDLSRHRVCGNGGICLERTMARRD